MKKILRKLRSLGGKTIRRIVDQRPRLCCALFWVIAPFINWEKYDEWIDRIRVEGRWRRTLARRKMFACDWALGFMPIEFAEYSFLDRPWCELDEFLSGRFREKHLIQKYCLKLVG